MKNKYEYWTSFDRPIPYKELLFYPVKMDNYLQLTLFSGCLTIDKDSIPDIDIISMTYLEYIYHLHFVKREISKDHNNLSFMTLMNGLLRLSLMLDENEDILYDYDNKKPRIKIMEKFYYSDDFDVMKDILCEQNSLVLPDYSVQKEIRDRIDEERILKAKWEGRKIGSLEDQLICAMIVTSSSLEEVKNLTVRKFFKILQRADHKLHYEIYLAASMSGFVKIDKGAIKHWMSDLEKEDQYEDDKIDIESYKGKFN